MGFSSAKYRKSMTRYNKMWRVMDETLYDLCRRHPGHADEASIRAKLWVIGRTYATGIERKIRTDGQQGSSMSKLAMHLLKNGRQIDTLFGRLRRIREPLTEAKLRTISEVHGNLIELIRPQLRHKRHSPRSFASKYMHFHCPAVPIIDNFAVRALRTAVPWETDFWLFEGVKGADEAYGVYLSRFWQLYRRAVADGIKPTVKHLDYCLLCGEVEPA